MATSPLRPPSNSLGNDIVDIKQKSLYARLKRLFSTDVVVRNIGGKKLKVVDTDEVQYATDRNSLRDRFNRVRSTSYNAYTRDFALSYQAARLDLFRDYETMDMDPIISCLSSDTYVSTLCGNFTIKELCDKYPNGESFEVWSWDNQKCNYTIGNAHHPRKTGTKNVIELVFDNGESLKCTKDHRILLINGTYKQAGELTIGDSVMPFLYKNEEYLKIKSKGKYKKAHRFIYEDVFEKNVSNRAIHHINHNKYDNRTCNLKDMSISEHAYYHGKSSTTTDRKKIVWSPEKKKERGDQVKRRFENQEYKEKFSKSMKDMFSDPFLREKISNTMKKVWKDNDNNYAEKALSGWKRWQNSQEGKDFMSNHSSKLNSHRWKSDENYREKMTKIFSSHAKKLWETPGFKEKFVEGRIRNLKLKIANDPNYTKDKYGKPGENNSNFNREITNEYLLVEGLKYNSIGEFAKNIESSTCKTISSKRQFINRRLKQCGYSSFEQYKQSYTYSNHKISKIIDNNEVVDVYDLTVDFFENFCLKSGVIVSNSALDVYADECLVPSEFNKVITIKSDNDNVRDILENLFNDILNIKFNLWSWTRNLCKYGDFYLKLHISPKYGVYLVEPIASHNVERIENSDPVNKNYVKFQVRANDTTQSETLENFEVAHFRLLSDSNFLPYGKAMIEGARRIWKQVSLMEDAMLIHRVMRAPEKRIFQVDVGNIPPSEVEQYMNAIISKVKKVPYVDEKTGDYNLRFNLQNMVEDFFLPVRGGDSGTKIDTLPGMEFTGIEDIEYLRNKMMAALKIPKAFLGYEEGISGKATLAAEDVRFSRTITRLQNILLSELNKIAIVHLYSQGYRDKELLSFTLELTNPSTIFEKEKVALWADKVDVAMNMIEAKMFSRKWIYKNVFNMTDDDIDEVQSEIVEDAKQSWRFTSIEEDGNDPAKPFQKINPEGESSGGEMGGGEDEGMGDIPGLGGGDELPIPPGGPEPMKEETDFTSSMNETESRERRIRNKNRPSQEGDKQKWMKKYDNVTFGEDPLGDKEINREPRKGRELQHVFRGDSPLSVESVMKSGLIKDLSRFLDSKDNEKKELLSENKNKKSMLDESNIIDK